MMKKMLLYYIKKRLPVLMVILIALSIMTIILHSQASFVSFKPVDGLRIETAGPDNPFLYLSIELTVLVTVLPILEFSFKMKRRSVDLYYSLPIKRIKLYTCKYLVGLIEFIILFIPQWLISFIFLSTTSTVTNLFDMAYFAYFLLAAIGLGILIYTFETFFFTMGNTLIDGIIFMVLASCFLPTLMNVMYSIILGINYSDRTLYMRWFFMYSPLFDLSYLFHSKMISGNEYSLNVLGLVINVALALMASLAFFFINSEKNNAELVGDESDTPFGYKVFIPMYMLTSFKLITSNIYALYVVVAVAGYLGYCVYRRSFRIKRNDILALGISIILGVVIALIFK